MINITTSSRYKINRKKIKETADEILSSYGFPNNATVNIIFIGKNKMKTISSKYKNEDLALPVLSFSYLTPGVKQKQSSGETPEVDSNLLGEVFICYPQVILLAAEREKKVDDIMLQLVKHGIENILK